MSKPEWVLLATLTLVLSVIAQDVKVLTPGQPFQDEVEKFHYQKYTIARPVNKDDALTITVTPNSDGDPDIFMSYELNNGEYPSMDYYNITARGLGEDSMSIADYPGDGDSIYVSIYGAKATSYTVLANFQSPVTLIGGTPQGGEVKFGAMLHYKLTAAASETVIVTVTPITGHPKLYVNLKQEANSHQEGDYQWSKFSYGGAETITIFPSEYPSDYQGIIYIGVYGVRASNFSVVAGSLEQETILRDGLALEGVVRANSPRYYSFKAATPGCTLDITLTPMTGDPDLFVAKTSHPSKTEYDWRSMSTVGTDTVHISPTEDTTYYITVDAFEQQQDSSFSIVGVVTCAHEFNAILLVDGVPQDDTLIKGEWNYYKFRVEDDHTDVLVSLIPSLGDVQMYVSNDNTYPNKTHCMWKRPISPFVVSVMHDDLPEFKPGTWIIGVWGGSAAQYTLVATSSATHQTLQDGRSAVGYVSHGTYEYFNLLVDNAKQACTITLSMIGAGDADLCVELASVNRKPTLDSATWTAQMFRNDSITLSPRLCSSDGCEYVVGVVGYTNSSFEVVAHFDTPVDLADGRPQSGAVAASVHQFFHFRFEDVEDTIVTLTLTALDGRPGMYVSDREDPSKINDPSVKWHTSWWLVVKTLTIARDQMNCTQEAKTDKNTCILYISVYGFEPVNRFTLLATTGDAAVPLVQGVPQRASVIAEKFSFFLFQVHKNDDDQALDLTVIVTPISGDPDLYVALNEHPTEDTKNCSRGLGPDIVDIDNVETGNYYIGVRGYSNTTFSVVALLTPHDHSDEKSNVITLLNGEPQSAAMHQGSWRYFSFDITQSHDSFSISVTEQYGDPDIYVQLNKLPTQTDYANKSTALGDDFLEIDNPQLASYKIGVYAEESTGFTITVTVSSSMTTLQNGVTMRGRIHRNDAEYYMLNINELKDVTVTVTPFFGDPDLYISQTDPKPNSVNNTWFATGYRDDSKTIAHTHLTLGPMYIAVVAYTSCDYSIVATFTDAFSLEEGTPQSGSVLREAIVYYTLYVPQSTTKPVEEVTITVTPISGSPVIYVHVSQDKDHEVYPDPENDDSWDKRIDAFSGGSTTISANDAFFETDTYYYIGVYGATNATYSIYASFSDSMMILQDGKQAYSHGEQGTYVYFKYDVPSSDKTQELTISLTPLSGDPDLYVSYETSRPTKDENGYNKRSWGRNTDVVVFENAQQHQHYYIGVYNFRNSTFTVQAHLTESDTKSMSMLVLGVPQSGLASSNVSRYYEIDLGTSDASMLTITLTRVYGDPDIYVDRCERADGEPCFPGPDAQWRSEIAGTDVVAIENPSGIYAITVYSWVHSAFKILASTNNTISALMPGVPIRSDLQKDVYGFFQFTVDDASSGHDLTVSVLPFNNAADADLFISREFNRPTEEKCTADHVECTKKIKGKCCVSAQSYRGDSITINSNELADGNYYIAVQARSDLSYSIVASFFSTIILEDGESLSGSVAVEASMYYSFHLPANVASFEINLVPSDGNAYLFVGEEKPVFGDKSTYLNSSHNWYQSQMLNISHNSTIMDEDQDFYILVYGATSTSFSIMASAQYRVSLIEGEPQQLTVENGQYRYFAFTVTGTDADIFVSLTPISGDPDMAISVKTSKPSDQTCSDTEDDGKPFCWQASQFGADYIVIRSDDQHFEEGTYYIGVSAWIYSSCTILVSVSDRNQQGAVTLQNGKPQFGYVDSDNNYRYYRYPVGPGSTRFEVTGNVIYGELSLFVKAYDGTDSKIRTEDLPSKTLSDKNATDEYHLQVVVEAEDACSDCTYYIAAYGNQDTSFSITATNNGVNTTLIGGIPVSFSLLSKATARFDFTVTQPHKGLFVATSVQDGDLYFTVRHEDANGHTIINQQDTNHRLIIKSAPLGVYHIDLYAKSNSRGSISAYIVSNTPDPSSLTLLEDGEPQPSYLELGPDRQDCRYFFQPSGLGKRERRFSLDIFGHGQADMFISNTNRNVTSENCTWSTENTADTQRRNVIHIAKEDSCDSRNCTYYIAVCASAKVAEMTDLPFSVTSFTTNQLLISGEPTLGTVKGTDHIDYEAIISERRDVIITSTTYSGEIKLCVSRIKNPTLGHCLWPEGPEVVIHKGDEAAGSGVYYIAVYGTKNSSLNAFSILVSSPSTFLRPGVPQTLDTSSKGTFFTLHSNNHAQISVSQITPKNTKLNLFLSTSADNLTPSKDSCTETSCSHKTVGDGETWDIAGVSGHLEYLGVFAEQATSFRISLSSSSSYDIVPAGTESQVTQLPQVWKYYETFVSNPSHIRVELQPCSGDAEMFGSFLSPTPDIDHGWARVDKDTVLVEEIKGEALVADAPLYLSVFTPGTSSTYRMIVSDTDDPRPHLVDSRVVLEPHKNSGELAVHWQPATHADGSAAPEFRYSIYYAKQQKDQKIVMYSVCGLEYAMDNQLASIVQVTGGANRFILTGLDPDSTYLVNVLVEDDVGLRQSFASTQGTTGSGSGVNLELLLGVGIPLLAVGTVVIVYLTIRNRNLTQELDIEMGDLPKSAIVKGTQAVQASVNRQKKHRTLAEKTARKEKYSRLLNEDDDLSDDAFDLPAVSDENASIMTDMPPMKGRFSDL